MKRRQTTRRRAKTALRKKVRMAVYTRSDGRCELKLRNDCIPGRLPFNGHTPWDHGHLVHLKSEGAGGKTDEENCRWGCWKCHLLGMHNGETKDKKPVPPKQRDWTAEYYGN